MEQQTQTKELIVDKTQKACELDLYYIKSIYNKLIVKKALEGLDTTLLHNRLEAVEIQIWAIKQGKIDGRGRPKQSGGIKADQSNG